MGQSAAKILNDKHTGKTYGVLTVLGISRIEGYRVFYKCKCSRCNGFTILRLDRNNYSPKSCSNCKNDLQREIADKKYSELRKYRLILGSYKGNAKTRNLKFDLSLEEVKLLVDSDCYYCGDSNSRGIDRVNNNDYYHKNNVIPCCKTCNFMKNNSTTQDFFKKIKEIYNLHLK